MGATTHTNKPRKDAIDVSKGSVVGGSIIHATAAINFPGSRLGLGCTSINAINDGVGIEVGILTAAHHLEALDESNDWAGRC